MMKPKSRVRGNPDPKKRDKKIQTETGISNAPKDRPTNDAQQPARPPLEPTRFRLDEVAEELGIPLIRLLRLGADKSVQICTLAAGWKAMKCILEFPSSEDMENGCDTSPRKLDEEGYIFLDELLVVMPRHLLKIESYGETYVKYIGHGDSDLKYFPEEVAENAGTEVENPYKWCMGSLDLALEKEEGHRITVENLYLTYEERARLRAQLLETKARESPQLLGEKEKKHLLMTIAALAKILAREKANRSVIELGTFNKPKASKIADLIAAAFSKSDTVLDGLGKSTVTARISDGLSLLQEVLPDDEDSTND